MVEKSASLSKFKVIQSTVLYQEIIKIRCLNSRRFCQVLEHLNVYNVCLHVVVVASVPSVVYFFSSFASHYACTVCFFPPFSYRRRLCWFRSSLFSVLCLQHSKHEHIVCNSMLVRIESGVSVSVRDIHTHTQQNHATYRKTDPRTRKMLMTTKTGCKITEPMVQLHLPALHVYFISSHSLIQFVTLYVHCTMAFVCERTIRLKQTYKYIDSNVKVKKESKKNCDKHIVFMHAVTFFPCPQFHN